ncbi:MAG: glycosyltransferase family 4 protein [Bacillota bacterium]
MQGTGKVLFVATVARHLLAFHVPYVRLLQEWGYEVEVACDPAGEEALVAALGVRLHKVPFRRRPLSLQNLRAFLSLRRLFASECYALVHVHTPVAAFITRLVLRLLNFRPVLYTAHGFHFYTGAPLRNWLLYFPMEWIAARWTDGLILVNREDYVRARSLPVRGDVFILPGIGVDTVLFAGAAAESSGCREELGLRGETPVVLVVAEFSRVKNHEQVLRAWKKVACEFPDAVLLLAGSGERRPELERLAGMLGLGRHVRFLGFRRDVPRLLAAADIVVLTSKREGLPRVVLEAMAAGKPVVATDVRGSRDLVIDGRTGYLVQLGDVAGTARVLLQLLRDRELRARFGQEGKRRVQEYELAQVRTVMAGIYRRYLKGGNGRKTGADSEI